MINLPGMTLEEAMYCISTYYSEANQCEKCPYYRSEKVVIDGHEFYKCKEQEAHAIAYTYILNNENAKNRKVINLGGI